MTRTVDALGAEAEAAGIVIKLQPSRTGAESEWQAEAVCDDQRVRFASLLALIRWLAALDPHSSGIR